MRQHTYNVPIAGTSYYYQKQWAAFSKVETYAHAYELVDEEETEEDLAGMMCNNQQPPSFQLSLSDIMPTQSCENCSATDDNFYEKLTSLKQQNIFHLQQLENELYNTDPRYGNGGKYKRSGSARSDTSVKRWCKMSFVHGI